MTYDATLRLHASFRYRYRSNGDGTYDALTSTGVDTGVDVRPVDPTDRTRGWLATGHHHGPVYGTDRAQAVRALLGLAARDAELYAATLDGPGLTASGTTYPKEPS